MVSNWRWYVSGYANHFTVGLAAMPISALWMTGGPPLTLIHRRVL